MIAFTTHCAREMRKRHFPNEKGSAFPKAKRALGKLIIYLSQIYSPNFNSPK